MFVTKFTRKELEARNSRHDAAIVIDNLVYDVSQFLDEHPGGAEVLLDNAGRDASQCFHDVGHSDTAREWRQRYLVGELVDEDKRAPAGRAPPPLEAPCPPALGGLLDAWGVWGPPLALALLAALLYPCLFG